MYCTAELQLATVPVGTYFSSQWSEIEWGLTREEYYYVLRSTTSPASSRKAI